VRVLVALLFVSASFGCAHARGATLPRGTSTLLDALPPSAIAYAYLDVAALRASPHARTLAPLFREVERFEQEVAPLTESSMHISEIAVAVTDPRLIDRGTGGIVFAFRRSAETHATPIRTDVAESLEMTAARCDEGVVLLARPGTSLPCRSEGAPNFAAAALRAALGTRSTVFAGAVDFHAGIDLLTIPTLAALLEDVDGGVLTVAIEDEDMLVRGGMQVRDERAAVALDYLRVMLTRALPVSGRVLPTLHFLVEIEGRYEDDSVEWTLRLDRARMQALVAAWHPPPGEINDLREDFVVAPARPGPMPLVVFIDDTADDTGITLEQARDIAELTDVAVMRIGPQAVGWSEDADAVLAHVRARRDAVLARSPVRVDLDRMVLVGTGRGGWIACDLAARQPRLAVGAVCIAPRSIGAASLPPALTRLGAQRFVLVDYEHDTAATAEWLTALEQASAVVQRETLEGFDRLAAEEPALADLVSRAVRFVLSPP
jgi:dienelactone hydrolase